MRLHAAALGVACSLFTASAFADITLVGSASIPGDALDRSNQAGTIASNTGSDTQIPQGRFGGAGSAIDYTGHDNLYLMASDRGPSNGDVQYLDRVHKVRLVLHPGDSHPLSAELVSTTLLTNRAGKHYTGSSTAFADQLRLDPEAVRCPPDGSFWLADEYGPFVLHFNAEGRAVGSFPIPAKYGAATPNADAETELADNKSGRQPNRGMEGLALSTDGKALVGIMQSPLIQDHGVDAKFKRTGELIRILTMNLGDQSTHEYVYPLDSAKFGVNEILALNNHEYLVIERDSKSGTESAAKHIVKIDLAGATDIACPFSSGGKNFDYSGETPANGLPSQLPVPGVTPVSKTLFLDMLNPAFHLATHDFPEKIEGIAWGPDFDNGDKLLIVTSDNDFIAEQPTWFYAFRVPASRRSTAGAR